MSNIRKQTAAELVSIIDGVKFGKWLAKNYFCAYYKDGTFFKDGKHHKVEDLYIEFKNKNK